jgi:hypothetical protein
MLTVNILSSKEKETHINILDPRGASQPRLYTYLVENRNPIRCFVLTVAYQSQVQRDSHISIVTTTLSLLK